ncbi:MAG: hypothetical protein ACE5D2_08115 [Fidelibacterota bacterium]
MKFKTTKPSNVYFQLAGAFFTIIGVWMVSANTNYLGVVLAVGGYLLVKTGR